MTAFKRSPITGGKIFLVFSLVSLDCLKTVTLQPTFLLYFLHEGATPFPPAGQVPLGYVHTIPDSTSYAYPKTIAGRASVYT